MKTTLTPQESATLITKGISADKASMCQFYSDHDGEIIDPSEVFEDNGKLLAVVNDEAIEVDRNIVSKDSDFDHSFADDTPIFTLADLIALAPKKIGYDTLFIEYLPNGNVDAGYMGQRKTCNLMLFVRGDELIDALYELLSEILE